MNRKQKAFFANLSDTKRRELVSSYEGKIGGREFCEAIDALMKGKVKPSAKQTSSKPSNPIQKQVHATIQNQRRQGDFLSMPVTGHWNPLCERLNVHVGGTIMRSDGYVDREELEKIREDLREQDQELAKNRQYHFLDPKDQYVADQMDGLIEPPSYDTHISPRARNLLDALSRLPGRTKTRSQYKKAATTINQKLDQVLDKGTPKPSYNTQPYSEEYLDGFWDRHEDERKWWEKDQFADQPLPMMHTRDLVPIGWPHVRPCNEEEWERMFQAKFIVLTRNMHTARRRWQKVQATLLPESHLEDPKYQDLWDINNVTEEQLMSIPGIGEVRADYILNCREHVGMFLSMEQVEERLQNLSWLMGTYLYLPTDEDEERYEANRRTNYDRDTSAWHYGFNKYREFMRACAAYNKGWKPLDEADEDHATLKFQLGEVWEDHKYNRTIWNTMKKHYQEQREDHRTRVEETLRLQLAQLSETKPLGAGGVKPNHVGTLVKHGLFCNLSASRWNDPNAPTGNKKNGG